MEINPYFGNPLESGPTTRTGLDQGPTIKELSEDTESLTPEEQEAKRKKRREIINTILAGGLYGATALTAYNKQVNQNIDAKKNMMDVYQQDPILDYNYMYGPNTSGGTEYQPIIKAKHGALVRGSISEAARFKIDDGELLMMPDGKLEKAKGNPSITDGVSTILPQGTRIYSNTLSPENSKKTFAQIAEKYDYSDHLKTLENPYSTPPSKKSAELMLQRKKKALDDLFLEQQMMNDFSSGEMMEEGGSVNFSKTKLDPIREKQFKIFYATLPDNLRSDDDTYDIRGYWDALGQPSKFDYSQPKENDGYYHGFSRHPVSGKILKAPSHPTFKKAIDADYRQGYEPIVKNGNVHTLQKSKLDPTGLLMKNGGKIEYELGGEYDLDEKEIKRLKKLGYKIEIL